MNKEQIVNAGFMYVNGLNIAVSSNTSAVVSPGQCRDSTNTFDMFLGVVKTLDMSVNGINGLDAGTFSASTCYNVFIVSDSTGYRATGVIASLSLTDPVLPSGYDLIRRIGFVTSDGSAHLLPFNQTGSGSEKFYLFQDPVSILSSGTQTSFTSASTIAVVPSILGIRVSLQAAFTPAAASNTANVRAGSSLGTNGQVITGQVTAVVLNAVITTISKLAVEYKVSAGSLNLGILSVVDSL